jgi:hypothetical protein
MPINARQKKRKDEFRLVCSLASAELNPELIRQFSYWNLPALDWNKIIRIAEHHGVLSFVARNLIEHASALPTPVPTDVERSLRTAYETNVRRGLWFAGELARIVRHFDHLQLPVLPFKGPVLAQTLYGDPGRRTFSDLDFLISLADFERAKEALANLGYIPSANLNPAIERFWLRNGYERSFDGPAGKNLVDLQWALLPRFYAVDLDVEGLLARSGRAVVAECEVRCLSPEDSLLVLSLHAAKHLWGRLIWLVDIAQTLRIEKIDYDLVLTNARTLGITRILGVTFWLVKNVLAEKIPAQAEKVIATDQSVATLGQQFAARLERAPTYDFASTEYFRLILKLRERRRDQFRYLWRLLWTPGQSDLDTVRLPEPLSPLYRIVRLGRLLRKRR